MAINSPILTAGGGSATVMDTVNVDTAGQVPLEFYDISDRIYTHNFNSRPFTVLLESIGSKTGHNDTHSWYERETMPEQTALDGSITASQTTLPVADADMWNVDDEFWIPSVDAQGLVVDVDTDNDQITVAYSHAPTAAPAEDAAVIILSSAFQQDDLHVAAPLMKEVQVDNYYQDIRHGTGIANQAEMGKYRTNPELWADQQRMVNGRHTRKVEKTLLFGQGALWTTGAYASSPRAFCRGLWYFGGQHETDLGGAAALTRPVWENFIASVTEENTQDDQDWWCLCSGRIQRQVSGFAQPYERTDTRQRQFGMYVPTWLAPSGALIHMKVHPMFHHLGVDDRAILVNMSPENIRIVYHSIYATRRYESLIPYGRSAREVFWRTIVCLEFKGEEINMARLRGVAAA